MLNVNYVRILEESGIFRYITPDDYEKAAQELKITSMKFVNNQVIFRQNDKAEQIAIVVTGEVKAEKIHGSGSDNMVHTYSYGNVFAYEGAISSSKVYPVDYISDGDSQIAFINVDDLYSCSFAKEIIQGIVGYMADESIRRMYRIEIMSRKKLRDRIMTYLRIEESEIGASVFTLDITREQLALQLGVNRSALSNELGKMQKEGIISINKRKISLNSK